MIKQKIMSQMFEQKLVVIIRGDSYEEGKKIIDACISGGIDMIEVTYSNSGASDLISFYRKDNPDKLIGAGTVLDSETARIAILSGAQFIVSPTFSKEIAKLCNRYFIPYLPGCMTLTECMNAIEYGVDVVKLFPSNIYKSSIINTFKGPVPNINIMPTGGINLENITEWLDKGATMIGVGGEITNRNNKDSFDEITIKSKLFLNRIKEWKNE
ncbi:bifunctional 2-keto-4-hydroxyglutarate aldolase/2-keto-3-deoxy-6-phosphogluconate aldolase [Virgibacillus sp. W0430]|uniref:bifunctional 2-keto-4-hydroxyglutarate aldolase/2-keto-3-deoxy-6-phosphogluconate aldolase n=1 Tax=Virgibacillus sp. W0430 TaxID=3391580 RepID=UPI003F44CC93